MEIGEVWQLFDQFNHKYFWGKLRAVKVSWSPNMTLCAGKTAYRVRGHQSSCAIRLSRPLLSQRPRHDTINTLLHEMIHAYLHVTQGLQYRDSHGPEFRSHMNRINALHGSKITIYHNFRKEVDKFRVHVYRCDGPCVRRRPFFGVLRRAIERPPGPSDRWWQRHMEECGGTFRKIQGPGVDGGKDGVSKLGNGRPFISPQDRLHGLAERNNSPVKNRYEPYAKNKNQSPSKSKSSPDFDADAIVKRIKDKHSGGKHTKLLSREEAPNPLPTPTPEGSTVLVEGNVNFNYKSKSPKKINLDKYLQRYKASGKCLDGKVDDIKEDDIKELSTSKANESSERCPVCSAKVPLHTYQSHLDKCFGNEFEEELDEAGVKKKEESCPSDNMFEAEICQNCGSMVIPAEMSLHLQYCIDSDDDEDASDQKFTDSRTSSSNKDSYSRCVSGTKGKGIDNSNEKYAMDQTLVSCPSCMEKVPEEKIQNHLDKCLVFLAEEF